MTMMHIDPSARGLRVLSIAHTAVSHPIGRKRYRPLVQRDDVDLSLLAPKRWYENRTWMEADPPQEGVEPILERIRFPRAGQAGWYLHYYPRLRRLIGDIRPDVIHLWEEPWSVVAVHAVRLRNSIAPAAAIVMEVDQNIDRRLPPPFESFRRYTLAHTDHVLARHQDAVNVVRSRGYQGDAGYVEYGCDTETFRPNGRALARQSLGIEGFTIGYAGRLVREKGLEDAILAVARCHSRVNLLIMGEGEYRENLEAMIGNLGLQNRVKLLPGTGPEGVAKFMRGVDVMVLLTRTTYRFKEQFGRVIMEAQACGTPVIGSTCGSIPDVIGPGGWIVPERDPDAAAACIDRLTGDPATVAATAEVARQHAAQRFTYDAVAAALLSGFDAATRSRRSARHVEH